MATTAPVSASWIPEDDLLLKNAIEAGASLEALAKGAIKFSRRFTYKELRDRWHSLLYDPDVSATASALMFELELSGFSPSTKSIKSENYKGHRDFPEKRKRGSIRTQYYAMKKKFHSEFFSNTDLGFLEDPTLHGHGSNPREPHSGSFISDNLGLQEADLDILRNVFPEPVKDYASTSAFGGANNGYPVECTNTIGDDYPNGILRNEFPPDISTTLRKEERGSSLPDIKCCDISRSIKNNSPNFGKSTALKEASLVQVPPGKRLFRGAGKKQLSTSDSGKDNHQNVCDFGESQHFDSPSSEGNSSLQVIGFPSPQPNLPLWKTMEEFSAPPMPICMSNQDTTQVAAAMLHDGVAGKQASSSVFEIVHSGPFLGVEQNSTDFMNSSAVSDGDFVDISDSLLNLSNEDDMSFMDIDEKDAVDKTLTGNVDLILQDSPRAVDEEVKVKCEPEMLMIEEPSSNASNGVLPIKLETNPASPQNGQKVACCLDGNAPSTSGSDGNVPSTLGMSAELRELDSGIIYCTLNTEDPDIPCNDDIFLLIHPSSAFSSSTSPPFSGDALDPASADGKASENVVNLSKVKDSSQPFQWHQNIRPSCSPDAHIANSRVGYAVKSELPDVNYSGVLPASSSKVKADSSHNRLSSAIANVHTDRLAGEDFSRNHSRGEDTCRSLEEMSQYAEAGVLRGAVLEPAINATVSDLDEIQSDDDVPYFSDVEAMILEMDLDPPEEDSSISRQALRYQSVEAKRTIMRLEQCARSCLQRTLTSRGAFAMLSGRHLKHYIRKTEVVLGRSTDDVQVDVDLRREGRASKISRRQAIIKMEADGSFSLKNIGKSAISVNGKSIITGQFLILSSGCLIEISRMSFSFEINQKFVRRYMDASAQKITVKNKYDWSPDDIA